MDKSQKQQPLYCLICVRQDGHESKAMDALTLAQAVEAKAAAEKSGVFKEVRVERDAP